MMKSFLLLGAALLAAPAAAQETPPPPPVIAVQPAAAIDPARLALARTAVDHVWPIGTYERMMRGTMDQMMDAMFESMFDMKVGDMAGPYGATRTDPKLADKSIRDIMKEADPHFQERMQIMSRVMVAEMIPLMNRLEPDIREGLSRAYANKFSAPQLTELNAFFATPTGGLYASQSILLFMDPEVTSLIARFTPQLVAEMPRIMQKVKEATAHLPPPVLPPSSDRRGRKGRSD